MAPVNGGPSLPATITFVDANLLLSVPVSGRLQDRRSRMGLILLDSEHRDHSLHRAQRSRR